MSRALLEAENAPLSKRMGLFERRLTLWVALCMSAGTLLGYLFPNVFAQLGAAKVAQVNLPVAVLI